ncbi:MAG: hypothetical protein JWM99_1518, partial [Verrucomicrobiales bacterium]|nr:hypothetical protein [Verrucomicrobiales bacterium]
MNTIEVVLNRTDTERLIEASRPLPGFCLMVDIIESTKLKDQVTKKWITDLAFTFHWIRSRIPAEARQLKIVGDMMMFWLPYDSLITSDYTIASFFQSLIEMFD